MVVQGSTGEAILLSDQERRDVLKAATEAAAPDKVLIAGTGIESAIETLRLTEYAASLGYDVAMVRTPHYYKRQMQARETCWRFTAPWPTTRRCRVDHLQLPAGHRLRHPGRSRHRTGRAPELIGIKESSG